MSVLGIHPEELLDRSQQRALTEDEQASLDEHLARCAACAAHLRLRQDVVAASLARRGDAGLLERLVASVGASAVSPHDHGRRTSSAPVELAAPPPGRKKARRLLATLMLPLSLVTTTVAAATLLPPARSFLVRALRAPDPEEPRQRRDSRRERARGRSPEAQGAPTPEVLAAPRPPTGPTETPPPVSAPAAPGQIPSVVATRSPEGAPRTALAKAAPRSFAAGPRAAAPAPREGHASAGRDEETPAAEGVAPGFAMPAPPPVVPATPPLDRPLAPSPLRPADLVHPLPEPQVPSPESPRPGRSPAPPAGGAGARAAGVTAAGLFADLLGHRRRGDVAGARAVHEHLASRFSGGREERAGRALLAQLLLEAGRAREALVLFERYLAGRDDGGPLAEEARLGRAVALQRLGRLDEERAAWRDLLQHHPRSVHAARARARANSSP